MQPTDPFIAVDWGTTNRRAWAIDAAGQVTGHVADDHGILSGASADFAAAARDLRARLGDLPMLLAGMIGSNRGWVEAPYISCPVSLDDLTNALVPIENADAFIVPGVSYADGQRCDVMRGEEVQLFGVMAAGLLDERGLICHPGTHAKWAHVEGGAISSFRTVMTGELFALLKTHSILAPQLGAPVSPGEAFLAGVDRSFERCELTAELFSIRAGSLLGRFVDADASAFASGLLIGADVKIGLSGRAKDEPVSLIGDPRLTELYAAAVRRAGLDCNIYDGDRAFLDGIRAIAGRMT